MAIRNLSDGEVVLLPLVHAQHNVDDLWQLLFEQITLHGLRHESNGLHNGKPQLFKVRERKRVFGFLFS